MLYVVVVVVLVLVVAAVAAVVVVDPECPSTRRLQCRAGVQAEPEAQSRDETKQTELTKPRRHGPPPASPTTKRGKDLAGSSWCASHCQPPTEPGEIRRGSAARARATPGGAKYRVPQDANHVSTDEPSIALKYERRLSQNMHPQSNHALR